MMTIKTCIEALYDLFEKYAIDGKIDKCPCGCISKEEEGKIYAKPLRELSVEDLGFYHTKAMTTWGNVKNFKYFLPRILELYTHNNNNGWIDLDTIYNKLEYGHWKNWDTQEQQLIIQLVTLNWGAFVNDAIQEIDYEFDFKSYLKYIPLEDLLSIWAFLDQPIALKNFVEFFYSNGFNFLYDKMKANEQNPRVELLQLLKKEELVSCLEVTFFKLEARNKIYADKVSTVLQMIEDVDL